MMYSHYKEKLAQRRKDAKTQRNQLFSELLLAGRKQRPESDSISDFPPCAFAPLRLCVNFFSHCAIALVWLLVTHAAFAQFGRADWHSGDYPDRNASMWMVLSHEFQTSFPRGGSPVVVKPFWQDDRTIYTLESLEISDATELMLAGPDSVVVRAKKNGDEGFFEIRNGKSSPASVPAPLSGAKCGDAVYTIENSRLYKSNPLANEKSPVLEFGRDGLPDDEVRDVVTGPDEKLYVATASGIGVMKPKGKWNHITGKDGGLPVNDTTALSFADDGTLWVGTMRGAARRSPDGIWDYRRGPRWMLGEEVMDIAAIENGGAWILTEKSLAHLAPKRMTLRDKAKHYDALTQLRHVRHGAVTQCSFRDPNDLNSYSMSDNDNDGLWTAIYTAAKCFEYGATKEPEALRLAKFHFDFLERLETINGIPGYISRSIRPATFDPNGHERYNYKGDGEWHESKVEPGWLWKSDTSSDEMSGHFFAWGVYYDLIAKGDPNEEARVQALVRRVVNHIIDNDFCLTDVDGHPTRWGIYSPRLLNGDLLWSDQIGFNSLGILAHLKVAIHICGDQKFKDAYQMLIEKHGYAVKAMLAKEMLPNSPYAGVNHSDDEMAWLEYYHLLLYPDENETLKWQYHYSAVRSMRPEIPERSPFFNFPFAVAFPKWAHVADGVETLKEWPLDLRHWTAKNSDRDDVTVHPLMTRHNRVRLLVPVGYDERSPAKWNQDPYVADGGDDKGRGEEEGGPWLLPYWMAVYHGFIVEEMG